MRDTQERVRSYFRVKQRQLAALADLPVCEHPGLVGGHREEIHRVYLQEVLPRRFEVGRGMVYGAFHRSKEADIVIWDSGNFPSLPMFDHSFFFAESVKVVLEVKSTWSTAELDDVLSKCKAVRDIIPFPAMTLRTELDMLQLEVEALKSDREHDGILFNDPHIGTAAIFLRGGESLGPDTVGADVPEIADDEWPDVLLLVDVGRVVIKDYGSGDSEPFLAFYDFGDDALLAFTNALLTLLADRSVHTEDPLYLARYVPDLQLVGPLGVVPFKLTRFRPQRIPLWRT